MNEHLSSGLMRHPDFLKLWFGQTISEFGSRISRGGIPLIAVITLSATPSQLGWLTVASALPVLLFGMIAGAWVDRLPRRPLMIALDGLRFGLLLIVPLAAVMGWLTLPVLAGLLAVMGLLGVMFDAAYRAYLPQLIDREQLVEGNTKLALTDSLAEIGGPALTGILVQAVGAPLAITLDAFTFLVGALTKGTIRKRVPPPVREPSTHTPVAALLDEIGAGIRVITNDPSLRTLAVGVAWRSFFGNFIGTLYDFYAIRELGLTPTTLGILIAGGGIGALVGAALSERVIQRWGIGRALIGGLLVSALFNLLIPLAGSVPMAVAPVLLLLSQIVGDGAMTVFGVSEITFRQQRVPDALLGRVHTGFEFMSNSITPIAGIAAGVIAGSSSAGVTLWIATVGILAVALWTARTSFKDPVNTPLA